MPLRATFGQKGTYIEAISGIDIALWDILGQSLGAPVYTLLGGAFRDRVVAYATGCYYRGEDVLNLRAMIPRLTAEARSYVDAGFTMVKTKVGLLSVEADLERLVAIREAIGPAIPMMVDANHAYNAYTAIRLGHGMEPLNVLWFEEPVPPEDRQGYRHVRQALSIPIAGGECEWTRYGFRDLLAEWMCGYRPAGPLRLWRVLGMGQDLWHRLGLRRARCCPMRGARGWPWRRRCTSWRPCRPPRTRRIPCRCRTSR